MGIKQSLYALKNKYTNSSIQLKASFWFLICSFLQKGIAMLTTPIFTRILNSEEYGQYNVFNSWLGIVTIFVSLNLCMGVHTQGLVKFDKDRLTFSSSLQSLTIVLMVIWLIIYLPIRNYVNPLLSLTTSQVLYMFVIIWTSAAFGFWASEQRVQYKYKGLVALTVIVSILNPLMGIVLIHYSEDKVSARILGIVIVELVFYSWCSIYQILKGKTLYSKKYWKYAVLYNLPLVPHYLSQTVLNNSDRIMINNMVGSREAGIYSLAYSLAMLMTLFSQALTQTLNPWFYQKIKDKRISDVTSISYLSLILMAAVTILLIIFAPEIVAVFAPNEYKEAIYCIPPVAMGTVFLFSFELFGKFAFYFEKTKSIMYASMGAAILNIVLNYLGIQVFGYMAAAYTTLLCYIAFSIFHYILMIKVCKTQLDKKPPYNCKILILMGICYTIVGFGTMLTYEFPVIRYSIIVIICFVMFIKRKALFNLFYRIKNLKNSGDT